MIYLDSSALMKLVRKERESLALGSWLAERPGEPLVTSELGRVETLRAARKTGPQGLIEAHTVLADYGLIPLNRAVQDLACNVGESALRTLDALHLASAILLGTELTGFVAYDHWLIRGARSAGLPVAVPE